MVDLIAPDTKVTADLALGGSGSYGSLRPIGRSAMGRALVTHGLEVEQVIRHPDREKGHYRLFLETAIPVYPQTVLDAVALQAREVEGSSDPAVRLVTIGGWQDRPSITAGAGALMISGGIFAVVVIRRMLKKSPEEKRKPDELTAASVEQWLRARPQAAQRISQELGHAAGGGYQSTLQRPAGY